MKSRWLLLVGLVACAPGVRREADRRSLERRDAGADIVVGHAPPEAPPPRAWCGALQAENAAAIARSFGGASSCVAPKIECFVDHAGVGWGFEIARAVSTATSTQCDSHFDVDLVRRDSSGFVVRSGGPSARLETSGATGYVFAGAAATVRDLGDWDDDGGEEMLFTTDDWDHEGGSRISSKVWTFASGALSPYARATRVDVAGTEDVDGDGKVDLLTRGPYGGVMEDGYEPHPIGPDIFVVHVGAGGRLSSTDAAARAYTAARCRAAREKNETIACARMHGKTEADVLADSKKAGDEEPWIAALAAVAPPFRIP